MKTEAELTEAELTDLVTETVQRYNTTGKCITHTTCFVNDLGLDSHGVVEIVLDVEHACDIGIDDANFHSANTVPALVQMLMAAQEAKQAA